MAVLTESDARLLLDVIRATTELDEPADFPRVVLGEIRRLVPYDLAAYNEVDRYGMVYASEPEGVLPPEAPQILVDHVHEHPLIMAIAETGNGSARAISDFLSVDQFHALTLYELIFGPLGIEDQLAIGLPAPHPLVIGIAVNRDRRTFTDRDKLVLDLLQPHLVQAHRAATLLSDLRGRVGALGDILRADGRGAFRILDSGEVEVLTPQTAEWLERHWCTPTPDTAPAAVLEWVVRESRRLDSGDGLPALARPLVQRTGDRLLTLRVVPGADGEAVVVAADERRDDSRVEALIALGLTPRQAQALDLLAKGNSNREIAEELQVSVSAVKRHLENVYRKLGVHTRAAAAALATDTETFGIPPET